MYRNRRYRKRNYPIARPLKKYSVENVMTSSQFTHGGTGWEIPVDGSNYPVGYYIVNPTQFVIDSVQHTIMGTRKAKNFTISLYSNSEVPILFAIIYKPEGVDIKGLTAGTAGSIYEPNQNVLCTGLYVNGQQNKWFTRLGRNLNSGDSIVLLVSLYSTEVITIDWGAQISYAISF